MLFHLDLIFILNISCVLIFVTKNPIFSALWLILSFFCSSVILWFFNAEFFALIYLIIYVGAIAVLFLFVIMMLDIKSIDYFNFLTFYGSNWFSKLGVFLIYIIPSYFFAYFISYFYYFSFLKKEEIFFFTSFDIINSIQNFGQVFYNYYLFCILISGLVLLVAIVGSIVLTLNYNNNFIFKQYTKQLSRSENFLSFFR